MLAAVEQAARSFTAVTLEAEDYLWALRHAAGLGARSGQIYDALILKCAERADAETIYTWNIGHFRRIAWQAIAERIQTP